MNSFIEFFNNYIFWVSLPKINIGSIFELGLLTIVLYQIVKWMRNSKTWILIKGIAFLFAFYIFSYIFQLHVFLFIFENLFNIFIIGLFVVFSPEIRKALEDMGKHTFVNNVNKLLITRNGNIEIREKFSDKSVDEIIDAVELMSKAKTGALMLFEQDDSLEEYDKTGILINADISKQLILNIFEHNTPLHDGALTLRNNKIAYGTCYLPLSESTKISKDLGTRHRAAIGASENKDCYVIIVSEETGAISCAYKGKLLHNISLKKLKELLIIIQQKEISDVSFKSKIKKESEKIVKFIKEQIKR